MALWNVERTLVTVFLGSGSLYLSHISIFSGVSIRRHTTEPVLAESREAKNLSEAVEADEELRIVFVSFQTLLVVSVKVGF